jgi:Holliday junction resolvase
MTHKKLVEIAYRWMLKNAGVGIAFKELKSLDREIPDVIGFDSWQSVLIECKVSRSDFVKDKKKKHREQGMGTWRFYCCPAGLIKKEELPEKWGLIYVNEKGKARIEYDCRKKQVLVPASHYKANGSDDEMEEITQWAYENKFDPDSQAERRMMYTALRRLFIKGHMKHIYDKQYNRSTTANELIELNSNSHEEKAD